MAPSINIDFYPDEHRYAVDGVDTQSVTQVLQAEGLGGSQFWSEDDRRRGTAVHRIALLIGSSPIRGKSVEEIVFNSPWDPQTTAPVLVGYGFAVARFYLESGVRPRLIEKPVASRRHGIAGTLDGFGDLPSGQSLLWDFKSGQPQPAAWVQTALYAMCLEESFGLKVDLRTVVWVKPDGSYKMAVPRPAGGTDLAVGISAINVYRWRVANRMM